MSDVGSRGAPMRVAEIVRPAAGGIRRHVETLLAGLDRSRFDPLLLAPASFQLSLPLARDARMDLEIAAGFRPVADWAARRALRRMLGGVSIAHAHGLRSAFIAAAPARAARTPLVVTLHNLLYSDSMAVRLGIRVIRRANPRVIAVSEAVRETAIASGLPASSISVIPNGVELPIERSPEARAGARSFLGLGTHDETLLAVGRISPEKGFDLLVDAFDRLHQLRPSARLLIVGDGPDRPILERAASMASLPVHWCGFQADIAPYYLASDLLIVPSRSEGQGIVALEAMAAGLPVVAFRVGGLGESIADGSTGLLVPPLDTGSLAEAAAALLDDQPRREAMGAAGRYRVQAHYTAAGMIAAVEALYCDVLKAGAK